MVLGKSEKPPPCASCGEAMVFAGRFVLEECLNAFLSSLYSRDLEKFALVVMFQKTSKASE